MYLMLSLTIPFLIILCVFIFAWALVEIDHYCFEKLGLPHDVVPLCICAFMLYGMTAFAIYRGFIK